MECKSSKIKCSLFLKIGTKYKVYELLSLSRLTTDIYTRTIYGNAKPTHIVRLVASLSSSIKQSGPQKD